MPDSSPPSYSTALLTDHYELTMLDAALRSGVAERRAVFEVFARSLPPGRRYGVVGGISRVLEEVPRFRFGEAEIEAVRRQCRLAESTVKWLADYRFSGSIDAYREGELYFPGSPICTVESTFGEAVLLETLLLSILNFDTAVASAASRMVTAAGDRPIIEMGSRRTNERAAVAAARAAFVAGFSSTSNLEAGRTYGIPTAGTVAHAFVMAHASESEAFAWQLDSLGLGTTLLVDTYDMPEAVREGVRLARRRGAAGPGAIRIDSGDLADQARLARGLLDVLGARDTRIVATSDLDEFSISALAGAPVDVYGVGTRAVTGSGSPTAGFVYKLVAIADTDSPSAALRPVVKRSSAKASIGGRKAAWRELDEHGRAVAEHVTVEGGSRGRRG